jgi:hypothetical protein
MALGGGIDMIARSEVIISTSIVIDLNTVV